MIGDRQPPTYYDVVLATQTLVDMHEQAFRYMYYIALDLRDVIDELLHGLGPYSQPMSLSVAEHFILELYLPSPTAATNTPQSSPDDWAAVVRFMVALDTLLCQQRKVLFITRSPPSNTVLTFIQWLGKDMLIRAELTAA